MAEKKRKRTIQPALTPEARESRMIALAMDQAEEQLLNGTASSQVLTHFLKLGCTRERLENDIRKREKELITAKKENLKAAARNDELYKEALEAMRRYSGRGSDDS